MSKRIIQFSPPDISELEINEITATLRSGWITTGPRTKQFEKNLSEYCGTAKTVCLNSATASLEMTLRVLGVGPGDEVITSAYTYTATAAVIDHVGAKIVFVDVEPNTYHIDYNKLADAITERTKVIMPVDIGGTMVDYDKVFAAAEAKKHLYHPTTKYQKLFDRPIVLADAAHSFGASQNGKMSGVAADFTCFSFHAVKNLTTAEGGAVTWRSREGLDNDEIYRDYQLISLHGQNKDAFSKYGHGGWEYDIVCTGYKCNMTDLTAAFGLKQLERFPKLIERRSEIYKIYDEMLLPVDIDRLSHEGKNFRGNYHLYLTRIPGMTVEQRNRIISQMSDDYGISCNVHFKPLPMMTAYKKLGFDIKDYPNAYDQFVCEITLPMHTLLTDDDARFIADSYKKIITNCNLPNLKNSKTAATV